jgi:glucan 1,3-beta-glucosidase
MEPSPLHGVNLGGWLVLERWMTPSLFKGTDAIDEYTLMSTPGAAERLREHWRTWITEEDFRWMAANGLNAVRIPVGYWVLEGDPPFLPANDQLDWAMEMAAKHNLQVVIDVHGLPGSQNGNDHSGRVGRAEWFRRRQHRVESLKAVVKIARRYRDYPNLWGFQIINEPKLGLFHFKLRKYYREAYERLVTILRPHTRFIYSDGFTPRLLSNVLGWAKHPVVMDVHLYHMATMGAKHRPFEWYWGKMQRRRQVLRRLARRHPLIIGEWSGVISGETMRSIPPPDHQELFRRYVRDQLEQYEEHAGWFYWSYKTEEPGQWNFRSMVEAGLIELPESSARRR